jgi:hypothetical protein
MSTLYSALVHHPVRDRGGQCVTTAITNLDVHDLARSSRTYDLAGFFVVTPLLAQRHLAQGILDHWQEGGPGHARVPERTEALSRCEVVPSVEQAMARVAAREGTPPRVIATAARAVPDVTPTPYAEARRAIEGSATPWLLLFGTGHGLTDDLLRRADLLLPPIRPGAYNHLSVRAAAAIVFDRLHPG